MASPIDGARIETTLPAKDLERAKDFYAKNLGLTPAVEDRLGVHYRLAGCQFRLFRSGGVASGSHTQLAITVQDIDAAVQALKSRGLKFEDYDGPNLRTVGSIGDLGYARAAWFKDSEGNLLGIAQVTAGG